MKMCEKRDICNLYIEKKCLDGVKPVCAFCKDCFTKLEHYPCCECRAIGEYSTKCMFTPKSL